MYVFAVGRRARAIENALTRYLEDEPKGLFAAEARDLLKGISSPSVSEYDLITWARDRQEVVRDLDHDIIIDNMKRMPTSVRRRCLEEITREIQK